MNTLTEDFQKVFQYCWENPDDKTACLALSDLYQERDLEWEAFYWRMLGHPDRAPIKDLGLAMTGFAYLEEWGEGGVDLGYLNPPGNGFFTPINGLRVNYYSQSVFALFEKDGLLSWYRGNISRMDDSDFPQELKTCSSIDKPNISTDYVLHSTETRWKFPKGNF